MRRKNSKKLILSLCSFILFLFALVFVKTIKLTNYTMTDITKLQASVQVSSSDNVLVSIIGDSMSTYYGYSSNFNITGNSNSCDGSAYYSSVKCNGYSDNQVMRVSETWWMRFIDSKGYALGKNASIGGTLVTTNVTRYFATQKLYPFNDSRRINRLGEGGVPDIIFVFGGMNDLANICAAGQTTKNNNCVELNSFINSYNELLANLKNKYPNSRIITIIPFNYGNNTRGGYTEIRNSIIGVSNQNNVSYVDLSDVFTNSSYTTWNGSLLCNGNNCMTSDLMHPTSYGMYAINQKILKTLNTDLAKVSIPSCNNITYNGSNQRLINTNNGYTISGTQTATNVGTYTATVKPNVGYIWSDGTKKVTKTLKCSIKQYNLSNSTIGNINVQTYTGSQIKPTPAVTALSKTLTNNTDYTYSYSNNTNAGTATVTVTGKGNYTGTKSKTFTINKKSVSIPTCSSKTYNKSSQTLMSNSTGYTVSNNTGTNAGTYKVTAVLASNYIWSDNTTGNKTITCTINAYNLSNASIASVSAQTYTGSQIKLTPAVTALSKTLTNNTDYTYSYSNNTNVGTGTITVTGKGNYTGSKNVTFTINRKSITIPTCSTKVFNNSEQLLFEQHTAASSGYTNSALKKVNAGSYNVTLTLNGNYIWSDNTTSNKTITCTISSYNLSNATIGDINAKAYTGSEIKPTPAVTALSKTLTNNTDYTYSYSNNTNVGTGTVTVTGKGNYTGTKSKNFTIVRSGVTIPTCSNKMYTGKSQTLINSTTEYTASNNIAINKGSYNVTLTLNGNYKWSDNSTGTKTITCNIIAYNLSSASISNINVQIYTGSEIKPIPTVTALSKALTNNIDYTISYSNNINVGDATITITGKGNYAGTRTLTFKIVTNTDISKLPIKNNRNVLLNVGDKKSNVTMLIDSQNVRIKSKETEISDNTNLKTGDKLYIYDDEYDIAILGDVNGDGKITIQDVSKLYAYIKDKNMFSLSEVELIAGDYAQNDIIQIQDVSKLYNTVLNKQ